MTGRTTSFVITALRISVVIILTFLLGSESVLFAQTRNLTVAVLVNGQNAAGYNTSAANPGEFQRFAERYLEHLQVPYELFDVSAVAPPADLSSRQLIVAGHSGLGMPADWRAAIVAAVNGGTGFVNLDSDTGIGSQSHMATMFGATGSATGTAATQISIPAGVAPGGATPHYIAAWQKKYDGGGLVYPFHADAGGVVRTATATVLQGATGTVIARLGSDPLILATSYGSGRAVHFGTLNYLRADRFGFVMGVDDLFWRSLVWAARKPFVVRGYPRLWAVQMDDTRVEWPTRVGDMYDPALTGPVGADGTGGPWKVTGYLYTDNLAKGTSGRAQVIADINAGKLEVVPHSFIGDVNCGNMYWGTCLGELTDAEWVANMAGIDAWKQGNGGSDAIPSLSRSLVAHYWDLSNNTGWDLWNRYGIRYVTSLQKPGFQSTLQYNGAERLAARPFWNYEMPPKDVSNPSVPAENYPLFFADDYVVGSRSGLPAQTFFLFTTHYLDFSRYTRVDYQWPSAWPDGLTAAASTSLLQQYTWRHWSGLGPVQVFTHDAVNYEMASVGDRQTVIRQASGWLNGLGVRHIFMDDLGDYIYARTRSKLMQATFDGTQLSYTFTGRAANADGTAVSTQLLVFQNDNDGIWQTVPGFTNGLQVSRALPPSIVSITPTSGPPEGGTPVTITGTGFTSASSIVFGQTPAASTTFVNSTTLQAVTPAGPQQAVDVKVLTPSGTATLAGGFTYMVAPRTCPCTFWEGTTPANPGVFDPNPVELGVKFKSDQNGFITAIRFYKGSSNTGTHVGHLWKADGTLLASATFTGETASGWQQANLSAPVAISAGATYVASYFAPAGNYAVDLDYFTTQKDNAPLHFLQDGQEGGNGLYAYAASPTFPTSTWRSSNYWVDVVFSTTDPQNTFAVTAKSPAAGATSVPVGTAAVVTFNKAANATTVNGSTFQLRDPNGTLVSASVTYNASSFTATLTPTSSLAFSTTYTATVGGGASGVKDTSGNAMASDVTWTFTTAASPAVCPCSIWVNNPTPATVDAGAADPLEVGVKFRSDVNGYISGIRFYKSAANTGTHIASLWSTDGTRLGTVTVANETASGWQEALFTSPIPVTAGTTYVASYFAPNGHYSVNLDYFTSAGQDSPPLHFLKDGSDGGNGVYTYGASSTFPQFSFRGSNYWVDVVFNTSVNPPADVSVSSVALSPSSVTGGQTSTGTVTLNGAAPAGGAEVALSSDSATATVPPSVNIPAGSSSGTFTVSTASVTTPTSASITASYNGTQSATLSIDPVTSVSSLSISPTTVSGGAGATGTVTLTAAAGSSGAVVALSSNNGAVSVPASITVAAGATTATFSLTTTAVGSTQTATITATYNGARTATLTVNAPTLSAISLNPTSVIGGANSTGTVTLNGAAPAGGAVVSLSSSASGAASVPANVTVAAGAASATFTVTTSPVSADTVVTITAGYAGVNRTANVTVRAASLSSLSLSPATVVGGASSTGTVTLNGKAPASGAIVTLTDANSATTVPTSVTILAGATSATFAVSTVPVAATTTGTVSGSYRGVTRSANLTVNAPGLSTLSVSPTAVTGGTTSTGTVTLNGRAAVNTSVTLSDNSAAVFVPASVTVLAGASSATFTIDTVPVTKNTNATISASRNGVTRNAALSVRAPQLASLSLSPTSVSGGNPSTGTVTLNGRAPSGGTSVALSSSATKVATVPSSVVVAAGQTTANFTVTTKAVIFVRTVTISGSRGVSRSATLTVTP
jgi:hypothetical protein